MKIDDCRPLFSYPVNNRYISQRKLPAPSPEVRAFAVLTNNLTKHMIKNIYRNRVI